MVDLKMPDINNILIAGNLTGDPVLRETSNGTPVANFYIAANRKFKDNAGQWRENVCFVGVVAWYKLAESCFEYLKKGASTNEITAISFIKILIEGPTVSFSGSPTVSPITVALWVSDPLPPKLPSSTYFFALSIAPPEFAI